MLEPKKLDINALYPENIAVICGFLAPQALEAFQEAYVKDKFPETMNLIWKKKFRIHFNKQYQYLKLSKENEKIDWRKVFKKQDKSQYISLSLHQKELFYILQGKTIQTQDFNTVLENVKNEVSLTLIDILLFEPIEDQNGLTLIKCAIREKVSVARNRFYEIIARAYHENEESFNNSDPIDNSLLHWAVYLKQSNDIIEGLVYQKEGLNKKNNYGNTPLYLACLDNYTQIVKILLQQEGINVNKKNNNGHTALHVTCLNGYTQIVKILLQQENINVNKKNNYGNTPLYLACFYGHTDIVELLLMHKGLNINEKDDRGYTPLDKAFSRGYIEIAKFLLKNGGNFHEKDEDGSTSLHWACRNGYTEIVNLLLEKGVNINETNKYGNTPLHWACFDRHIEIVKMLLINGADPKIKNGQGQSGFDAVNTLKNISDAQKNEVQNLLNQALYAHQKKDTQNNNDSSLQNEASKKMNENSSVKFFPFFKTSVNKQKISDDSFEQSNNYLIS